MKKSTVVIVISLLALTTPSFILAQAKQQGQNPTTYTEDVVVSPQAGQSAQTASQNLNRVVDRTNNPETGQQIRSMVENHEKIQLRTKTVLQQMEKRNQAVKFLLGPDYKNAGQVRSDVVGLRNDIRKLEQIKDGSTPTDVEDIQGAIDELQLEADGLETQLEQQLSGFSLFGWLAKLLAK